MRMRPSQSTVMNAEGGIDDRRLTTSRFKAIALGDRRPVVDTGAAERVDADANRSRREARPCR